MIVGVVVGGGVVVVVVVVVVGGVVVAWVVVGGGVVVTAGVVVSDGPPHDVRRQRKMVINRMIAPIVFIMLFISTSQIILFKNKTPQPQAKGLKRLNKKSYNSPAEYCRLYQGLAFWLMMVLSIKYSGAAASDSHRLAFQLCPRSRSGTPVSIFS
jgi:hypothetical protein